MRLEADSYKVKYSKKEQTKLNKIDEYVTNHYNKVSQINSAIDKLIARMKEIDDTCLRLSSYHHMPEELRRGLANYTKSLLNERKQLFETYQKDLKELYACFNIGGN